MTQSNGLCGLLFNKFHLMPLAPLAVLNSDYYHENLHEVGEFTNVQQGNFRFVSYAIVVLPLIAHDACYTFFAQVII